MGLTFEAVVLLVLTQLRTPIQECIGVYIDIQKNYREELTSSYKPHPMHAERGRGMVWLKGTCL